MPDPSTDGGDAVASTTTVLRPQDTVTPVEDRASHPSTLESVISRVLTTPANPLAPFVRALASGAAALRLSVAALGLEPGDEVLVPALADDDLLAAVLAAGAIPVVCDVDADHGGPTATTLAARCSDRTRAVVLSHPFGWVAPEGTRVAIADLADRARLAVLEDGAVIGAGVRGTPLGRLGTLARFPLGAAPFRLGAGALVVATDPAVVARLVELVEREDPLPPLLVDAALAVLARLDATVAAEQAGAAALLRTLAELDGVRVLSPAAPEQGSERSVPGAVAVAIDGSAADVCAGLSAHGIRTLHRARSLAVGSPLLVEQRTHGSSRWPFPLARAGAVDLRTAVLPGARQHVAHRWLVATSPLLAIRRTEPATTEPDTTEPDTSEPAATGPDTTGPDTSEPAIAEPAATEPDTSEPATAGPRSPEFEVADAEGTGTALPLPCPDVAERVAGLAAPEPTEPEPAGPEPGPAESEPAEAASIEAAADAPRPAVAVLAPGIVGRRWVGRLADAGAALAVGVPARVAIAASPLDPTTVAAAPLAAGGTILVDGPTALTEANLVAVEIAAAIRDRHVVALLPWADRTMARLRAVVDAGVLGVVDRLEVTVSSAPPDLALVAGFHTLTTLIGPAREVLATDGSDALVVAVRTERAVRAVVVVRLEPEDDEISTLWPTGRPIVEVAISGSLGTGRLVGDGGLELRAIGPDHVVTLTPPDSGADARAVAVLRDLLTDPASVRAPVLAPALAAADAARRSRRTAAWHAVAAGASTR